VLNRWWGARDPHRDELALDRLPSTIEYLTEWLIVVTEH
jgi:hypothetical protein